MTSRLQIDLAKRRLSGESLTRSQDEKGVWQPWQKQPFQELYKELDGPLVAGPRIFSVDTVAARAKRLNITDQSVRDEMPPSYEVFSSDNLCIHHMTDDYGFPDYLFEQSWYNSNGFAGSKTTAKGVATWFRVLVKVVSGMNKYHWHEMTFFIHQPQDGFVTVICFELPNSEFDPYELPSKFGPSNFLEQLGKDLSTPSTDVVPDWRSMQAILLRRVVITLDTCVWACSKQVRTFEKSRSIANKNNAEFFSAAHDLLRHTLHNAEVIKVAIDVLNPWIANYHTDQKRLLKRQIKQAKAQKPQQPQNQSQTSNPSSSSSTSTSQNNLSLLDADDDDNPLLPESHYDSMISSVQLLNALSRRSESNEARLRNEISLAFNLVTQADTRSMHMISLVTLLFLPATFVSTLFSMSFFSYQDPTQPTHWTISRKIWIYFVVAGALTIIAAIVWVWGGAVYDRLKRRLKGNKQA